jgi:hypothetical protein
VDAGEATVNVTANGNYTGTVTKHFDIAKAELNGGEEPGGGMVPQGGFSKFDVTAEYDGAEHTVDAEVILATFSNLNADVVVAYALTEDATDWTDMPEKFVNVCETSIWYKVTLANYEDFIHAVKITITPRDIANAVIDSIDDIMYDGASAEPTPIVTDGDPSIIAETDYTVSYSDNDVPGLATVYLTGTNNYTGTTSANFTILAPPPSVSSLKAEIKWVYLRATGTYFAQLKITCTNGLEAGISDLKFLFADRIGTDGATEAALWNSLRHAANSNTTTFDGETYRYAVLDASQITEEDSPVVFGVSNAAAASIPVAERSIEMYVHRRVVPQSGNEGAAKVGDFVGYVFWTSGGETQTVPVVAGTSTLHGQLMGMRTLSVPISRRSLNASLAVGVPLDGASSPYCSMTEFTVDGHVLRGRVEVGMNDGGSVTRGTIGGNVHIVLLGSASPAGPFAEVASVETDGNGRFTVAKPGGCQFFRLRLDIIDVVK